MLIRRVLTVPIAFAMMVGGAFPVPVIAQQGAGQLSGTAEDEATRPIEKNTVRARLVDTGTIVVSAPLDAEAAFMLAGLQPGNYVVELLDPQSRIVCTEGPFQLTAAVPLQTDIEIDCDRFPVAWWLLGAAAAAGVTTAVVVQDPASPSQ